MEGTGLFRRGDGRDKMFNVGFGLFWAWHGRRFDLTERSKPIRDRTQRMKRVARLGERARSKLPGGRSGRPSRNMIRMRSSDT